MKRNFDKKKIYNRNLMKIKQKTFNLCIYLVNSAALKLYFNIRTSPLMTCLNVKYFVLLSYTLYVKGKKTVIVT